MATVTVGGLTCEETYSIVAGGLFTDGIDQTLDGPRFHSEIITASTCPLNQTMTTFGKRVL